MRTREHFLFTKEVLYFDECIGGIEVFDDTLGSKQKPIDSIFTRELLEIIGSFHFSQSFFDLPKAIRNKSNMRVSLKQTLKDVEKKESWKNVARFDMRNDEFQDPFRETWEEEDYVCLHVHTSKKKNDGRNFN